MAEVCRSAPLTCPELRPNLPGLGSLQGGSVTIRGGFFSQSAKDRQRSLRKRGVFFARKVRVGYVEECLCANIFADLAFFVDVEMCSTVTCIPACAACLFWSTCRERSPQDRRKPVELVARFRTLGPSSGKTKMPSSRGRPAAAVKRKQSLANLAMGHKAVTPSEHPNRLQ